MIHITDLIRLRQSHIRINLFGSMHIKNCQPLDFIGDFNRYMLGRSAYYVHVWSRATESLIISNVDVKQKNTLYETHGLKSRFKTFDWVENVIWSGLYSIGRTSLF